MGTIYVVMGSTGEYSDRTEWSVCYYTNEESAKEHVKAATRRAKEIKFRADEDDIATCLLEDQTEAKYKNSMDPNMRMYYTGTRYYYMTVSQF